MQLEFDFTPAQDLRATAQEFFHNVYSILIWTQILTSEM